MKLEMLIRDIMEMGVHLGAVLAAIYLVYRVMTHKGKP